MRSTTTDSAAFHEALRKRAGLSEPELERLGRADVVKAYYIIEPNGDGTYLVKHPFDDDRAYNVDPVRGTCECMDWQCTSRPNGWRCKHSIAIDDLHGLEELLRSDDRLPQIMLPDPADAYRD